MTLLEITQKFVEMLSLYQRDIPIVIMVKGKEYPSEYIPVAIEKINIGEYGGIGSTLINVKPTIELKLYEEVVSKEEG